MALGWGLGTWVHGSRADGGVDQKPEPLGTRMQFRSGAGVSWQPELIGTHLEPGFIGTTWELEATGTTMVMELARIGVN